MSCRALAVVCLAVASGTATAKTPQRYFVLELGSNGVDEAIARNLSEVFIGAIRGTLPDAQVVGQADVNSMLALEKNRDLLGCADDTSCLAEVGGALGADYLAVGSIGRIGKTYLLTLKLIDTARAETTRHVSEEIEEPVERLIEATRQWGANLVDPSQPTKHGYIAITGPGRIWWDGTDLGPAPIHRQAAEPGEHTLVWEGPDGRRHEQRVRVPAYDTAETDLTIDEPAPPVEEPPTPSPWFGRVGSGGHHALDTIQGGFQKVALEPNALLGIGYTLSFGLQVFVSGSWFNWQLVDNSQEGIRAHVFAGGIGVGYETEGDLRFSGATTLEVGRISTAIDNADQASSLPFLPDDDALVLVWNTYGAVTYRVWRYLDIGLRLVLATHWTRGDFPVSNDTDRLQTLVSPGFGLVLGVGPWR